MSNVACFKSFWGHHASNSNSCQDEKSTTTLIKINPFSQYHVDQPHAIRKRHDHLGAAPKCRASVMDSMKLLRKVLQPAINQDIKDIFKKYVEILKMGAENGIENHKNNPQSISFDGGLDIDGIVYSICKELLENSKLLFQPKSKKIENTNYVKTDMAPSPLPLRLHLSKRAPSPDLSFKKVKGASPASLPRSFTPPPSRKRSRITGARRYGSPHKTKEPIRRDGPTWDPDNLTESTRFVMGTKANKALGLGATRGRIYMKHPELFKYGVDQDDKKWMVKNNCMPATGGKNTFILLLEDVENLLKNEYKESPGLMVEELSYFLLPEFILQKMRSSIVREKQQFQKLQHKFLNAPSPLSGKSSPSSRQSYDEVESKSGHGRRNAARAAEQAITVSQQQICESDEEDFGKRPRFTLNFNHQYDGSIP